MALSASWLIGRDICLLAGSRAAGEELLQSALERLLRNWRRSCSGFRPIGPGSHVIRAPRGPAQVLSWALAGSMSCGVASGRPIAMLSATVPGTRRFGCQG
jgi:hypothetical protein